MSSMTHRPTTFTALAGAMLAVLLVFAEASIRTTVIIDNDVEAAGNWWGMLGHCQQYVMNEAVRGGNGQMGPGSVRPGEMDLEICCRQLKEMETEGSRNAYCMGIEKSMRQLMEQPRTRSILREEDMQSAWEIAEALPGKCDASLSRCNFFNHRRSRPSWF